MKKVLIMAVLTILVISSAAIADDINNSAAYKLNNGRISVREDVFNQLVTNEKLLELYKAELEKYRISVEKFDELNTQNIDLYENRISTLEDIIKDKDDIITYKDNNIKEYESLYKSVKKELSKQKTMSFFQKLLVTAVGVYAISELDSNTPKVVVGAGTVAIWFYDGLWR